MVLRIARASGLFVGLAGCSYPVIDVSAECLKDHPGAIGCCFPGTHIDHGTCCPDGSHALVDVEHEDWRICVWDEEPCADAGVDGGACRDAGAHAEADAGTDAP